MTGFREQGSGIPLTLLHGISSGAASWHKQMALPGYRVLAWDMPGYGESPMLAATPADAGDYADALARMLDRAGVEQTILVGHSLGRAGGGRLRREIPAEGALPGARRVAQGYGQAEAAQREKSLAGASTADSAGRRGDGPGAGGKTAAPWRARSRCGDGGGGDAQATPRRLSRRGLDAGP